MLALDGSFGEGGGQILRSALSLSLVTGKAFRIDRIRARRQKPGLRRQHLTAVQASARIGQAEVVGAAVGSSALTFTPGRVVPGEHTFAIGTAGSATLVFQALLPALLRADGPSVLRFEGGTHNHLAPPYEFLEKTYVPMLTRMGARVSLSLERRGFYPAGGGRFTATVDPAPLSRLEILERGEVRSLRATAVVSALPADIARRELATLAGRLPLSRSDVVEEKTPYGPGNAARVEVESDALTEVVSACGARGVPAEAVADRLADEVLRYLDAGAPVGEHLADQLLLPMALAGEGAFVAAPLSPHATTHIEVIRRFLDVPIAVERQAGRDVVRLG
ncbi:MAG TPA: RNA 3'-terminal phosphate cyclase [Planctomycetota bacterium]|nr:RNA 3'-terminal phosphate cyclase [Planctomycetota bacterium]